MKKLISFLFSMTLSCILMAIFAIAIAYATFIENAYGTTTAKILVYNSRWIEVLLFLLIFNLIGGIFRAKFISKRKGTHVLLHLAFIVILIGAAFTRYLGFEGKMHIRENTSTDFMLSDATYIRVKAISGGKFAEKERAVRFSPFTTNRFSSFIKVNGQKIHLKSKRFVASAISGIIPDPEGNPVVALIAIDADSHRFDFCLTPGEIQNINGVTIGFETGKSADIHLKLSGGRLLFCASDSVQVTEMMQQERQIVAPRAETEMTSRKIYSYKNLSLVVKQFAGKGRVKIVSQAVQQGTTLPDAIQFQLSSGNESKELIVFGKKGEIGRPYTISINGVELTLSYGTKKINLPFSIHLKEFRLERYPGSNSPSSYASKVVLKDGKMERPFRIFMNNTLKYKGYRFFQSSYDTDEAGTILAVSHDALGTNITYWGYLLLAIGFVLALFNKNSRFQLLLKTSRQLHNQRKKLFTLMAALLLLCVSTEGRSQSQLQGVSYTRENNETGFEKLLVQDRTGRIEPVSTLASEILRKITKKNGWKGMQPAEVFLDMQIEPGKWKDVPFIKVAHPKLRKILGDKEKYTSFNSVVKPRNAGGYKLRVFVQKAYEKNSSQRTKFDKEVLNVDERINIIMAVFRGDYLAIFPVPGDNNHRWVAAGDFDGGGGQEPVFAIKTLSGYINAVQAGDWKTAHDFLTKIKQNQQQYGAKVLPPESKIKLEVFYNRMNIFGKLSRIFLFTGLILLLLQLLTIFYPAIKLLVPGKAAVCLVGLLFLAETAGLVIRWYISGHAPWSNGYESMVFISWACCLGGLIFSRRSGITLAVTAVLSGLALLVAGMSWMSPEITNLVPVLKSYWLILHVAVIITSYGFLAIGALLGLLNLVLMVLRNQENRERIDLTIRELVTIVQIALIIGLVLLTLGSFLGAIWANESWGRYWGWDPKETWALITVLVYACITHMHKIPGLRGNFAMSTAAILGFGAVLMTYFGVNFYLSGLHSYAQGEAVPVPLGVYIALGVVVTIIVLAFLSERKKQK